MSDRPADPGTSPSNDGQPLPGKRAGPVVTIAVLWTLGVVLGAQGPSLTVWTWLFIAAGPAASAAVMAWFRRPRAVWCWTLLALLPASAAWTVANSNHVAPDDISHYAQSEPQLARVTGVIDGDPRKSEPPESPFATFSYEHAPAATAVFRVVSIEVDGVETPASGGLLLRLHDSDDRLADGTRLRATGWLGPIQPPANPGEFDYRALLADRGIRARLSCESMDNLQFLGRTSAWTSFGRWHRRASNIASASLQRGLSPDPQRQGLLDKILLGRSTWRLGDLEDSFRRTGLYHLLSISGAHMAILLGMVWLLARAAFDRPAWSALAVLLVLGFYLLALPAQPPILRSGIMAAVFALGYLSSRQVRAIDLLALSLIMVLMLKPADLFTPGFQLSFAVTAGLILWTRTLSQRLWPQPLINQRTRAQRYARSAADLLAANLVGFAVSAPLILFHFRTISPLVIPLTILLTPLVAVMLIVGYLKITLGLLLPGLGSLLSWPLARLADAVIWFVNHAADTPGSYFQVPNPPSLAWTLATLALVIAWLSGRLRARRWLASAPAAAISIAWLVLLQYPGALTAAPPAEPTPVVINSFSVGNGSCHIVRLRSPDSGQSHTLMFDAGSSDYLDVGRASIVPALRELHVDHIDTLFISHADLDHFSAALDIADAVAIKRVFITPQFLAHTHAHPSSASAFLLHELDRRKIPVLTISRGWREFLAGADLELLWPPADLTLDPRDSNDTSTVLSIRAAGRRILFSGDIQDLATHDLLKLEPDLRADIAELPHHGGFRPKSSPDWLKAVDPRLLLQSVGADRHRHDRWDGPLARTTTARYVTATDGMISIAISPTGALHVTTFRPSPTAAP